MSCHVGVGPAIEKAEMLAIAVIDGKSVFEFDGPPRPGKTVGYEEILRGRKLSTKASDGCCRRRAVPLRRPTRSMVWRLWVSIHLDRYSIRVAIVPHLVAGTRLRYALS
jgi:hypothetical protein